MGNAVTGFVEEGSAVTLALCLSFVTKGGRLYIALQQPSAGRLTVAASARCLAVAPHEGGCRQESMELRDAVLSHTCSDQAKRRHQLVQQALDAKSFQGVLAQGKV